MAKWTTNTNGTGYNIAYSKQSTLNLKIRHTLEGKEEKIGCEMKIILYMIYANEWMNGAKIESNEIK